MKIFPPTSHRQRNTVLAIGVSVALLTTGCAGGVEAGAASKGGQEGFDFGAAQAEVDEALENLEPVELIYQTNSQSPKDDRITENFVTAVEERSGGKITVEPVYAQGVAGYSEIDNALADGRIDISYHLPSYHPSRYPAFDALTNASVALPSSPVVGTLAGSGAIMDLAWQSDMLLEQYEAEGIVPLVPAEIARPYFSFCTEPTSSLNSFGDQQIRIGSSAHMTVAEGLGATPISMEYTETFEALQRNALDCTITNAGAAYEGGVTEVASHVSYPTESSWSSIFGAWLAGASFPDLPLAYQQIIFDAAIDIHAGNFDDSIEGIMTTMDHSLENGGSIEKFDPAAEDELKKIRTEMLESASESGKLEPEVIDSVDATVERWLGIVEELGYEDGGSFEDMSDWYNLTNEDYVPFAERVFEETALNHRPM
jgi:TRAP-type C4-dicarboxylate transport system substrate-binding protein